MRRTLRSSLSARVLAAAGGAALCFSFASALYPTAAAACGCFAPPDPSVPIVQAGERILFAHENGQVTAYIQVQYSGKPGEFGWLLPLPAVPKTKAGTDGIDVGVDELFTQLLGTTQPKYRLTRVYDECSNNPTSRNSSDSVLLSPGASGATGAPGSAPPPSPLVIQDSVGPYDYAVLKADNKDLMVQWLNDNHYFIPTGTLDAAAPYLRPGAFFLALRLKAGLAAGDLQPVVLRYQSDLPMIPIILTSVAAQPNMGIQVWMLGAGRAIPRNYYHTVINDSQVDWLSAGQNYNDVIIKAVGEADGHHSFVTEYAGTSAVMQKVLNRPGRFGDLTALAQVKDPSTYVQVVLGNGFTVNGQLTAILSRYIPEPAALKAQNVTLAQYYQNINFYLGQDRTNNPRKYDDIAAALAAFDPKAATDELSAKIVQPTLDAGGVFDAFPYLTRLYTTLSPADMNKDPVFSYNPSLPDYSNIHQATLTYHCAGFFSKERYSNATLQTESGFTVQMTAADADANKWTAPPVPFSQQIQTLLEVGPPQTVVDNTGIIKSGLGTGGCSLVGFGGTGASSAVGLLLASAGVLLARRRRQNS